ncbi:hypothetical protein [Bosea sp. RAC05]|uniref:hypothetical protein n=1 Tax=Bosea sp. RAC05 TaxID=1842539 RepID=UPI00083E5721|nr:hypothetical protein [Bosea sp. RAC05]AOG02989.1 hypothetical protein BSY19_4836 [Bosea sp. RAC05]
MDLRETLLLEIARRQASLSEICTDLGILDTAGRKRALSAVNRLKREKIVELARYPNGRAYPNGIRPHLKLVDKTGSEAKPATAVRKSPESAGRTAPSAHSYRKPILPAFDVEAKAVELAAMLRAWTPISEVALPDVPRSSLLKVVRFGMRSGALACIDPNGKRCEPRWDSRVNVAAVDYAPADIDDFLIRNFCNSPDRLWALLQALDALPTDKPGKLIPWQWWEMPKALAVELIDRGLRSAPPLFHAFQDQRPAIVYSDNVRLSVPRLSRGSDRPLVWISDLVQLVRAGGEWKPVASWAAETGLSSGRVCAALELGRRNASIVKAVDLRSGHEAKGPVRASKHIAYSVSLRDHPDPKLPDHVDPNDGDHGVIATSDLLELMAEPTSIDELVEMAGQPRNRVVEAIMDMARAGEVACIKRDGSEAAAPRYVWSGAVGDWDEEIERTTMQSLAGEMALEHTPIHRSRREHGARREGVATAKFVAALNRMTQPVAMPALAKALGLSRERIYQILASVPPSAMVLVTGHAGTPVRYLGAQRALKLGVSPQDLAAMRRRVLDAIAYRPIGFKGLVDELGGSELLMGIALGQMQELGQIVLDSGLYRRPVLARDVVQFCSQWRSEKAIRSRFAIQSREAFVAITADRRVLTEAIAGGFSFWAAAGQAPQIEPPSPAVVASVILDGDTRTATRFRELMEFCREWRNAKEIERQFGRTIKLQAPQFVKRGLLIVRTTGRRYGGKEYLASSADPGPKPG